MINSGRAGELCAICTEAGKQRSVCAGSGKLCAVCMEAGKWQAVCV